MRDHACSHLPDKSNWSFDEIAKSEPVRASALEAAGPPEALLQALKRAAGKVLSRCHVRIGRECAKSQHYDYRGVVQFDVDVELFDWFFNARTGYRAHFRADHEYGLRFNRQIIETLRLQLATTMPDPISCRELNSEFQDCGEAKIPREFLIDSLVPDLSKVWFCTMLIKPNGGVAVLPTGVVGPKILLGDNSTWAAPYRENDSCWLEIKGAFLGKAGPYQPKDPIKRAIKLQATGEA